MTFFQCYAATSQWRYMDYDLIFLYTVTPRIAKITTNPRKIKNSTLAIDAAPAATPPKPKMAATIATKKNIPAHFNIV